MSTLTQFDMDDEPLTTAMQDTLRVGALAEQIAWSRDQILDSLPKADQRRYRDAAIVALRLTDPQHDWIAICRLLALDRGVATYADLCLGSFERSLPSGMRGRLYHILTAYCAAFMGRLTNGFPVLPSDVARAEGPGAAKAWLEGRAQ